MKTNAFIVMAFFAMVFMGCSVESIDPIDESANLELSQDNPTSKAVTRPFKVRGSGTLEMVEPTECVDLYQIDIQGQGNATHLGRFTVVITYCTDFQTTFILTGTMTAANGDELYFYSVGGGTDMNGDYTDYLYDGGTGRFEYVTGELKLYDVVEFTPPGPGVYTNHGFGTLTF